MAHYHLTVKPVSRRGGKSAVAKLAYRSATDLKDLRTGETHSFSSRRDVFHVDMLLPDDAPSWIVKLAAELQANRQYTLQKFSDIIEAAEKRINSRVYREVEFALPNELTNEQNISWSKEFVRDFFCKKGMVAVVNYHGEVDDITGIYKPHCHVLLSTRNLAEEGFSHKNREWDSDELVEEWREQFANYQNAALKEHGFDVRVTHLSYEDRELDIDPQTKLGKNVREMTARGIETDKQKIFDIVRLKNQFRIVKNPELVFKIVTSMHATFTRKDIARVLHRYIDDPRQFQTLLDRLMASKELVDLESSGRHKDTIEPVYTTREMLRIERDLVQKAEALSARNTHPVSPDIIEKVIARHHGKFKKHGGLSADQEAAIRHMLSGDQISCVVGFAGAGKTTCLEAVREAWEEAGYRIIGIAPTGKAARNMEGCGIRSMTIHKFLYAQNGGRERISENTIVVADEFGMVDCRRGSELLSLIDRTGAKVVPMGDGHQAQSVEAGAAFRLLTGTVKPVVLEKVVRQKIDWQREASRLFGTLQSRSAVKAYLENGCFTTIEEKTPDFTDRERLIDHFCLSRQMSGRIWKEMVEDCKGTLGEGKSFDPEQARQGTNFEVLARHQDFSLFQEWKDLRETLVFLLIDDYGNQQERLKERGVDVKVLSALVTDYKETPDPVLFQKIEIILRRMSYDHIADTRGHTREALVKAWVGGYEAAPEETHLMLAFTNKDANRLNEAARTFMREQGNIQGKDFKFVTQRIETDDFGVEHRTYHDRVFAEGDRILFTRNSNSLDVKNGSLGTILKINKGRMTVSLDTEGDEQRTLSFSPNLYPFIDNGWATTIIKAQGVTVDHIKLLASFEQYRNLAYVGMSRHRLTLQVFASSLDFWREEKIVDRLGRVQEKLSSFDYLTPAKIREKLEEDTEILWHHQKIQQGKDFWRAIKVTARDVLDKVWGRPQDIKVEDETFQSFDDTEEVRSRDFFKVDTTDKEAFEDTGSGSKPEKPVNQGRSVLPEETFKEKLKTIQDKINKDYTTQTVIQEKPLSFKEVDARLKERIYELATSIFGEPNKHSRNSTFIRFGELDEFSVGVRGEKQGIYTNFVSGIKGGPLKLIEDQIGLSSAKDALKWGADWLGGNAVVIEQRIVAQKPDKDGQRDEHKDEQRESTWKPIVPIPENVPGPDIVGNKYLNVMLKGGNKETSRHAYRDAQGNLLGYVVRIEKPPVVQPDGSVKIPKVTPPLAYGEDARGYKYWKWKAFYQDENRIPYGLEKLAQDKDQAIRKPVLVVEGEKTADKAQKDYPGYHVLTWLGGAGAVGKTDWTCLVGRQVTIWPDYDYDQGSQKAAQKLLQTLTCLNRDAGKEALVGVVDLPDHLRHGPEPLEDGWDLADPLPKHWTPDTVRRMIREALPQRDKDKEGVGLPLQRDPLLDKREQFEKVRLPINQQWCATLGFMIQNRRLPATPEELSAAWWQGERLTAIEGRLYRGVLGKGGRINEKRLTLNARKELSRNQSAPDPVLLFGKASNLTEDQLKQFEQHALIHRDRTNRLPNPSEMEKICQAVNVHCQRISPIKAENISETQKPHAIHTQELNLSPNETPSPRTLAYRFLIEQQAVLAQIRDGKETSLSTLQNNQTQSSCSEKLNRIDEKVRDMDKLSREIKDRDLNRQSQRGMDL